MRLNRLFSVAMLSFLFGFCRFPPGGHRKMGDGCVGALTGISPPPLRSTGHQPACGRLLAIIRFSPPKSIPALINHFPLSNTIFLPGANPKYQYSGPGSTADRSPVPPAPAAAARCRAARPFLRGAAGGSSLSSCFRYSRRPPAPAGTVGSPVALWAGRSDPPAPPLPAPAR